MKTYKYGREIKPFSYGDKSVFLFSYLGYTGIESIVTIEQAFKFPLFWSFTSDEKCLELENKMGRWVFFGHEFEI